MAVDVIPRAITERVREALADTPVVVINGARQVGKSTLVRGLAYPGSAEVVTFDDPLVRAAAQRDPRGFLQRDVGTLVIDEAQLVPEIFRVVKAEVDLDRRPGRFILTGSSRLLAAPDMADSLVGRVEVLELSPFTQAELDRTAERFIDTVFDSPRDLIRQGSVDRSEIIARVCRGGFPDAHARSDARRSRWFDSYVITTVERVVRELAELERLAEIPRLLQLCAARTAQEVNVASISGELGIPVRTVSGYVARLETAFLLQLVPAWSTNLSAKVVRKPKLVVIDSGLAAHLIGATPAQITRQPDLFGPLLETFVCGEIRRQLTWSRTRAPSC